MPLSQLGMTTIGLVVDAMGAIVVLGPRLPILMRILDRFWWFKKLEDAKAQLYHKGEIGENHAGFQQLASAVKYGTNWTTEPGEQFETGGKVEMEIEFEGEKQTFEAEGFDLFHIERVEDPEAYPMLDEQIHDRRPPLMQTIFELAYRPKVTEMADLPEKIHHRLHLAAEMPPGQLPRFVEEHKERLAFRLGAGLLFVGFTLQLIAQLL